MVNVVDSAPPAPPVPKARPARAGRRAGESWIRRVPLVPALVFMFIVTQLPFVLTLWYSFQRYNLNFPTAPRDFPTLWNYDQIFGDHVFRTAVLNTVLLTAVPVIASVLFGMGIALLLNRHVFGRGFLRTLIISPFLVMPTAAALVWKFTILDTTFGVLNFFLRPFGLGSTDWIGQHSQLTIIAFETWMWTPFMVLLVLAGLQSQGLDQLEAARVDGAARGGSSAHSRCPSCARISSWASCSARSTSCRPSTGSTSSPRAVPPPTPPTCRTTSTKPRSRPSTSAGPRRWR